MSSLTSNTDLVNNGTSFLTSSLGSLVEVAKWLQTVIGKVSSVFGKFFNEFNALGGTQKAIDGFNGAITFLGKVISAVKDAFKEVFTTIDTDANPLYTLVSGFKDLIDKCNSSTKVISNVKRIAKGLFAAIDIGIQAFTTIGKIIGSAFTGSLETTTPTLKLVAEKISDIVAAIADVVVGIDNMIKKVGGFETIQSTATSFIQKFKMAIEAVGETVSTTFNNIKSVIEPVFEAFKKGSSDADVSLSGLSSTTQKKMGTASNIVTIFRSIGTALKTAFENLPTMIENVKTVLVGMITTLDEVAGYLWDTFSPILDSIVRLWNGALSHFGITLDNAGEKIVKSGFFIGLILLIKALKDVLGIGKSAKGLFDSISGYFKNKNKTTIIQIAGSVLMFAGAISLVAFSLIELSQVPWDNMKTGLIGLVACVAMLGVILLAVSALMKREKSTNGFFEGEGYSDTKYDTTGIYQLALSLLMIGVAIRMCAKVVESLGDLNTEELIQGIAGLWGIVSILELYIIALSEASKNMQSGTVLQIVAGILLMSSAINKCVKAITVMGEMDPGSLKQGIFGFLSCVLGLVAVFYAMPDVSEMQVKAKAFESIAVASLIAAAALRLFATMSVDEMSDALFGFAATITTFMVVLYALQEVPNTTQVAASILILSGAMIVMGAAMKIMSTLMWEDVATGLTVVAGVLLLFGAAAAILNKLGAVSAMIALAGALILFNASIVVLAAGIISLGLAFEFICGIIASLNGIGQSVIDGFAYLGPIIAGLCDTIVQTAPNMSAAATALIISFCQAIIASTPLIVAAFAAVVTGICASADTLLIQPIVALLETLSIAIREVVNRLVDDIFIILTNFVDLLFEFITVVAGDLIVLVVAVIEKLADAIVEVVPYLVQSGIALITGIILGIAEEIPSLIAAGYILIISFIDGLADSIETYQPQLNAAIDRLLDAIKEHIIDGTPIGAIVDFVGNIKDSFVEEFNNIKDNITGAVDNAVSGIKNFFGLGSSDEAEEAGKESAAGYANGIKEGQKDAEEAAESLGESTVDSLRKELKVASPSKEFAEVGEYSAEGYTEGIESGQDDAEEAASDLGNNALSTLLETFGLSSLADGFDLSSFTDGFDLSSITDSLGDGFDLSSITDSLGEGFDLSSITDGFDTSSITDNIDLSSITDGFDTSSFTSGINLDTSGLTDSMSDIDWSAYTDDSTITTAITPVIDDSEIQNGKYDAMENVTISTEGSTESITKAANTLNTDNSTYSQKIVDAVESVGDSVESGVSLSRTINNTISKITERISDLEDAITKMQVVLDTGTLVGELSSSVDATLGTTTAMKARGV